MHKLAVNVPWEDEHKPVVFPYYVRVDKQKFYKGDSVVLIVNGRAIPTAVISVNQWGDIHELALVLA